MSSFATFRDAIVKSGATRISDKGAKSTDELVELVQFQMKKDGRAESDCDMQACIERKSAILGLERKANEIMNTGNVGYGAELVPGAVTLTDFLDMAPMQSKLLSIFQAGYHGKTLPLTAILPIIGEVPLHQLCPEQTTGAFAFLQGISKEPTAKVTLQQKEFWMTVDISEYEARFAILDVIALIKQKLAASAANTQVSMILNGDTATGANTNINCIDGTPVGTEAFLGFDGLRKTAISVGSSLAFDAGTFGFANYLAMLKAL